MNLGKIGGILKKAGLTILGAAVPGGGIAAEIVKKITGLDDDSSEEQMEEALKNPETLLQLKQQEQTHEKDLIELTLKREQQEMADRQHARTRDVEIQKIRGSNRRADVLAYLAVAEVLLIGGFLIYLALSGITPPVAIVALLSTLLGGVLGYQGAVYQFEFGSSKGSRDKDVIIGQQGTGGGK